MAEKFLLKDFLFNQAKVEKIAGEIRSVHPSFKAKAFVSDTIAKFPELELKGRISWISTCLKKHLPGNYREAVEVLLKALPPPNDPKLSDDDFGDFIYAAYLEYVAKYGCTKEHLSFSLKALREMTKRFSAEDAIRYFINAFPTETLKVLSSWTKDSHYHVRRLCSEGTRPKLPWSQKIGIDVSVPMPILDELFCDRTRYVIRSVANHINDISKVDADLAMDTLAKWKASGKQNADEMDYIVRHALRTLVKQGNPKAMNMLGLNHDPKVSVSKLVVPKEVKMNTALDFSFTIQAEEDTEVIVDYTIYFQSKSGKPSKKVFKLTKLSLAKGKPVLVSKLHMLREKMTTRTLYPGLHEIEIQINGKLFTKSLFILIRN